MDLFNPEHPQNILPYDGCVEYWSVIFNKKDADRYFKILLESLAWENDKVYIFGKEIITKRKIAWYGDRAFGYTYSNYTKKALPWTQELLELKKILENKIQETFNSCLVNLYHDGSEGMAWHSDGEKDLKKRGTIASLTFGAERKFSFKHKNSKEKIDLILEHGSLLLMKENTQDHWLHRLPPTTTTKKARINLTFRNIIEK